MYVHVAADVIRMCIQYTQEKDHMFTGASLSNWYLLMTFFLQCIESKDKKYCMSKQEQDRKKTKEEKYRLSAIKVAFSDHSGSHLKQTLEKAEYPHSITGIPTSHMLAVPAI